MPFILFRGWILNRAGISFGSAAAGSCSPHLSWRYSGAVLPEGTEHLKSQLPMVHGLVVLQFFLRTEPGWLAVPL